jgi:hypothetical protein
MEVSSQLHVPAALPQGKQLPGTDCVGGWLGPRTGMDVVDERNISSLPPGIESRFLGRPADSVVAIPTELPYFSLFNYAVRNSDCIASKIER